MIKDIAEADEQMAELFRQEWVVKKGYACDWPNMRAGNYDEEQTWARWAVDYVDGRQVTLAAPKGRKFSKSGLIYVVVFSPLGYGLKKAREDAQVAIDAYEGKRTPGDVWFRNVRIESEGHGRGGGGNKSWWTTTVVAEFTYEYLR